MDGGGGEAVTVTVVVWARSVGAPRFASRTAFFSRGHASGESCGSDAREAATALMSSTHRSGMMPAIASLPTN